MPDKFTLEDFQNDKSIIKSEAAQSNYAFPIKTTASQQSEPAASLTSYDVSSVLQGYALYKPAGATYDAFNNHLSNELQNLGTEAKWANRESKLTPYDVFLKDVDPKTGASIGDVGSTTPGSTTPAATTPGGTSAPPLTSGTADAFCIGDSISVGCQPHLEKNDKGWHFTVNAKVSRPPSVGLTEVKARNGDLGSVVVVNLGTNPDAKSASQWIGEMMGLLSNVPRVCFVTCNEWNDYPKQVNVEIHALKDRDSKVVVVDWAAKIAGNRGLLSGDGVHPTVDGYGQLTNMILEAIGPAPKGP